MSTLPAPSWLPAGLIPLRGHRSRLRSLRHRIVLLFATAGRSCLDAAKRLPMPPQVRRRLYDVLPWRPGTSVVPLDRVLLGGQNRQSAADFARSMGDPLWPSTPVALGPHADLLLASADGELTDEQILGSRYAQVARVSIEHSGQYFAATDDAGIIEVARRFIARPHGDGDSGGGPPKDGPMPHQTRPGQPVLLAPIRDSDCYQVIDGHHRLAALVTAGATTVEARVKWLPVSTPLQDMLDQMSWIGGERELYQPVRAPELERSWVTVRACVDRQRAMEEMLLALEVEPTSSSYLDVASCYGWFVARMLELGYDAHGVERDPLGRELGSAVYGLDPSRVSTGDAVELLRERRDTFDVVSCFSLLHHFALGRGSVSAEELVRLLSRVTGKVLFLDTGQAHEAWFASDLPEWDSQYVADFLTTHGDFERVIDLGADRDAVEPYEHNYGRHLFACVKGV